MNKNKWLCFLVAIFSLFSEQGFSKELIEPLIISENINENINKHFSYYIDSENKLDEFSVGKKSISFAPVTDENLALSAARQTLWAKIKITNNNQASQEVYLNFAPSYLGKIDIFSNSSKELITSIGSLRVTPKKTRSGGLVASLLVPTGSETYLIKIESIGAALSVNLSSKSVFLEKRSESEIIFSFIIGALMILGLYHLFIFVTSKDLVFFHYVMYIFSMIFFQLGMTGFNRYIMPVEIAGFPYGYLGSLLAGNSTIFFLSTFTYKLLELKNKPQIYRKPLEIIIFASIIASIILITTQSSISIILTRALGVATVFVVLSISTVLTFKKNYTAAVYLFSWFPLLAGTIILVMTLSGVINESIYSAWALPFGSIAESLLLALAIGNQLQKITKEKLHEQSLRITAYEQIEENFEKMKARDKIIKTYVSPTILTELALGKDPIQYPPQHIERAILFTDIRNYTGLTEKNSSEESFQLLNYYFKTINSGIFNNRGEVDKLIGDAVMATFKDPIQFLKAYKEFRNEFNKFNKKRREQDLPAIRFGSGVSYGEVLSANFGSIHKIDRTIVGDTVNIAARYEGLTKTYRVNILATHTFIEKLGSYEFCRPLDFVKVKGKSEPKTLFEIFSDNPENVRDFKIKTIGRLEEVVLLKKQGKYKEALMVINELIADSPKHNYNKNEIMDASLLAIKKGIDLLLRQRKGSDDERSAA